MRLFLAILLAAGVGIAVHQVDQHELGRSETQSLVERNKLLGRVTELEGEVAQLRRDVDDRDERLAQAAERERARKIRASRSRRLTTASPAHLWATSSDTIKVMNCESADLMHWPYSDGSRYLGGDKGVHLRDPNGHFGKYQFWPPTWRSVGGVGNPADATEAEQDYRGWLLWKRDGWGPWTCARKLGIS